MHRKKIRMKIVPLAKQYGCFTAFLEIDLFTDSDAILKILSIDFCAKVKVNSDTSLLLCGASAYIFPAS